MHHGILSPAWGLEPASFTLALSLIDTILHGKGDHFPNGHLVQLLLGNIYSHQPNGI